MTARYLTEELRDFAAGLFEAGGMPRDRAEIVARYMVEADLMVHDTHGLNLAPLYLDDLETGRLAAAGEPETVRDTGATVVVAVGWLSGLWLIDRSIDLALERVATYGTVTVVMRRAHHSGCLAAFLEKATARGRMIMLSSSAPAARAVAPHGSYEPVYTPAPLAFGIPTEGDPVLVDISASTTTMNLGFRLQAAGKRFGGPWLIDGEGRAMDDPNLFSSDAPGAIMPLGGLDLGHKGFGLGIFVEALTSGLGGYGRADAPDSSDRLRHLFAGDRSRRLRWQRGLPPSDRLVRRDLSRGQGAGGPAGRAHAVRWRPCPTPRRGGKWRAPASRDLSGPRALGGEGRARHAGAHQVT